MIALFHMGIFIILWECFGRSPLSIEMETVINNVLQKKKLINKEHHHQWYNDNDLKSWRIEPSTENVAN